MRIKSVIQRLILIFAFGWTMLSASAAVLPVVPRWQPQDFEFTAKTNSSKPFYVSFNATVTAPDGKSFVVPGFYDGNGVWKIRVSPTMEGHWTLLTRSELPDLDNRRAACDCGANTNRKIHGILRVDREHPHHFIFDDGTRFFMQGYEYDWLWALDMDKPNVPTVDKTLDLIASYGFNYVILNSFAYDTSWRKGKTSGDDYGPPLMLPWEGDNNNPDWSHMNLAYWKHYDQVISALFQRGIEAHMLIKVYNKSVNWPAHNSPEEQLFFRWLLARYSAYPNIIWDFSKEAHNEKDVAYKQQWLKYIRETDPYSHLVTVHDDDKANDGGAYDELTDFRADQEHHRYRATILRQRERRAWPVANVESDYECGFGGLQDKTYRQAQLPGDMMRTLWEIAMAGGYVGYYYTYTAWDVVRPLDEPPGYALMKHFGDFWRSTDWWQLQPTDGLIANAWCLANPGREYVIYQNDPKPFTLEIKPATIVLTAQWFNPFTGEIRTADGKDISTLQFNPPSNWTNAPVVLNLRGK